MGESAQKFDAQNFDGIVQLKQYAPAPDGRQYIGFAGKVSVLRDKDVVGFEVKGGDTANWVCRIEGRSGSINVLGCQIKLVHQFDGGLPEKLDAAYYLVP